MNGPVKSGNLRAIVSVPALAAFAAASIWINYQVKVNVQGGSQKGITFCPATRRLKSLGKTSRAQSWTEMTLCC
jgi:hypothetical protein